MHAPRWRIPLACLLAATSLHAANSTVVSFAEARRGMLPPGFRVLSSSEKEPGRWQVDRVDGTQALTQAALGKQGYRLAVLDRVAMDDLHVGVRLRVGRGDRAAGVAWRVQDASTYYAARLDLDEREVVLYKFVHGNRVRLDRVTGLRLDADRWHQLLVEHTGTKIRVWLNGIPVAVEDDDSIRSAGAMGFWMPGDGTASFERLWYRPLAASR